MTHCPNCGHELHPKPEPLTTVQLGMLKFICKCINELGVAPSYDEMMDVLELKSKSPVHRTVKILERKGWIKHYPARPRGISVLHHPDGAA